MKLKGLFPLLAAVLGLVFFSCSDNPEILKPDVGVVDPYSGEFNRLMLGNEMRNFHHRKFTCVILTPDGTVIERDGEHLRLDGKSHLSFKRGIKSGVYRLLALRVDSVDTKSSKTYEVEYGLGCRVDVNPSGKIAVLDSYNEVYGFSGKGTESDPFIVSSSDHLKQLRNLVNDESTNSSIRKDTYFKQYGDIDMWFASWKSNNEAGWLPIGSVPNDPYRGHYDGNGFKISNLYSIRANSSGIGLFGFVENAVISRVTMVSPRIEGAFAVGGIVGGIVSPGDKGYCTIISACNTTGGKVSTPDGGIGAGGLVGVVDMKSSILIDSCSNDATEVSGMYGTGGLLGAAALNSITQITNSINRASVTSTNTGAGGLVGSADTLKIVACENIGEIEGSKRKVSNSEEGCYGTGGLVGGSGPSQILASKNSGKVSGYIGVGGIIGSTRIGSDQLLFNNALIKSASNSGEITGEGNVGGICGEAQFGGYQLLNTGTVRGTGKKGSDVGGIAGNTSIAVVYNALNSGAVSSDCTSGGTLGGILGKSVWASLLTCQNLAAIKGEADHMGGVVALAGNNTVVNFSSNAGSLSTNRSNSHVGGIVGELGDQHEWSAKNTAAMVFGTLELVLGVAGPTISALKTMGHAAEHVAHVLHMVETTVESLVLTGEATFITTEVVHMVNKEACELMKASVSSSIQTIDSDIRQQMKAVLDGFSVSSSMMQAGISTGAYADFTANINALNAFNEANDENNELINENMNLKREERMEAVEKRKEAEEIIHKAVGGVCVIVSSVALVVSCFATAGATIPAAVAATATVAATTSSIIGGVNSITEAITDYEENVAIVSQCANYGTISSHNKENTGAIVGCANDCCWIKDCINVPGTNSPSILSATGTLGSVGRLVQLDNSLLMGENWNALCLIDMIQANIHSSVFFTKEKSTPFAFDLTELSTLKNYKKLGWDISAAKDNNTETKWVLKEEKGYYPIPQRSEMTDEIEEE